jgi:serine/threonine-protein kinase
MGVVYRAEDTNLNRQVAIKVLPDIFAGDPERLVRFVREARLLASLNHPNIAAIHGLEEADGKRSLIVELPEGETLAKRISRGPLPVDEALEVCKQVAEGLEAAHEKGIIHRDLKPANVKITQEGKVEVLTLGWLVPCMIRQQLWTCHTPRQSPTTDRRNKVPIWSVVPPERVPRSL